MAVDEAGVHRSPGEPLAQKSFFLQVERSARERANGVRFLEELSSGSTAATLSAVAAREDVEVLVVGSTHLSDLGRIATGSVGDRLLDEHRCAIAIAPLAYRERRAPIRCVGYVAVDGIVEVPASELADLISEAGGCRLETVVVDSQSPSAPRSVAELSSELDLLVIPDAMLEAERRELISAPPCPVIVVPSRPR